MRVLRISFIVLALTGLVAVAGCGSSDSTDSSDSTLSSEEYGTQLTTVMTNFGTSFQSLAPQISSSKNLQDFQDSIATAEQQMQSTIDDLSALNPPAEAQDGQDQLVSAFENFSSKLSDVGDASNSDDPAALKQAALDFQDSAATFQTEATAAFTALDDAGITIGPADSAAATDSTTG